MSSFRKWSVRPGTLDDMYAVFDGPDELGIWDKDADLSLMSRSQYIVALEKEGELFGAWGIAPFSPASTKAWVWLRTRNPHEARRPIILAAHAYFGGLLETVLTDIFATTNNEKSETFVKHFGFKRDTEFELSYNVTERKIYRKSRDG